MPPRTPNSPVYDDGTINQATRQQLQHSLDLEAARLSEQR
jgi:hypothetical protein